MHNQPHPDASLVACLHCDLLQRLTDAPHGASVRCPRCDKELWRPRDDSLNRSLALTLAAAVLYIIANTAPMLGLTAVGHAASTTVLGGAVQLWNSNEEIVAVLVLFAAVIAPALQVGLLLSILLGARLQPVPTWVGILLRHVHFSRTWSMIEVMLLGVLVAITKIAEYATVIPGVGIFSLGGLVVLLAAIQSTFDPREVWNRVAWAEADARQTTSGGQLAEATS